MLIGPVWALAIMGAETAPAATAAVFKRPRRLEFLLSVMKSLLVKIFKNLCKSRLFDELQREGNYQYLRNLTFLI
jgi:hypothetical protein